MNLANLENAREQLLLAGDRDDNVMLDVTLNHLDDLISNAEAELPVVPTIEVGQVWVSDTGLTLELLGVGTRNVLCRNHWGAETIISISMLTKHWTLHTPAPKPTPLTADDVSESVWRKVRNTISNYGSSDNDAYKRIAAAVINAYLAEVG